MGILDSVNTIMVILCIVAVLVFGGIILFNYLNKKKRYTREKEGTYTNTEYADSSEIVPFDDIKDGMIIENAGRRFSAVILTASGDFYNSSAAEMIRKQNGYISFIRTIREDISFRQSPENVNLEYTKHKYDEAYKTVEQLLFNASESFKELKPKYDAYIASDGRAPKELEDMLVKLNRQIKAYNWRLNHIEDQKKLCDIMSGPDSDNERFLKAYCVSWESVKGVLGDGIPESMVYKKAREEIDSRCEQMIRALKAAGLSARRAGTQELIDLCRKHSRPLTGNLMSISDTMENTDWDTDVVRTDSFNDLKDRYRKEMAERMLFPYGA